MIRKAVLITGSAMGTGYAIAEYFAKYNYDVFITSRTDENLENAVSKIKEEYKVFSKGYILDSDDEKKVIEVFEDIKNSGYLIDCIVLNAANLGINQDFFEVSLTDFMNVFEVNIGWNFTIIRQAVHHMIDKKGGSIVFISSNTAYRVIKDRIAYCASKSAILGLSRALALELGKYGIRSNCILPGMIKTDRWYKSKELRELPSNNTPLGDIADFDDIASAAWFLSSEHAKNITGTELVIDGGNMIQLYPSRRESRKWKD